MKPDLKRAKKLYSQMLLIRRFEEKCVELYSSEKIRGFLHLYIGEEAVAAGVMEQLSPEDAVVATYREHGQAIAKGVPPKKVMAELYGKQEGCALGRGGSMHLFDKETNFCGGNAIVAAGLPVAVGMALADKMAKRNRVTVCLFGDGAVAEGEFHESLNLASLWQLPILFICENNRYAMGTAIEIAQAETDISKKAESYKIPAMRVDGMDVLDVAIGVEKAVEEIRDGKGPAFIEALTYRFRAHSMFDPELYRSKEEVSQWKEKDPLIIFKKKLKKADLWKKMDEKAMEEEAAAVVAEAVEFAENGTLEPVEDLTKFVYSERGGQ